MKTRTQRGFTLTEVLVASAIVIAALGSLMQLFGAGLERMHRAGSHAHRILAQRQVLSDLSEINPAVTGQGEGDAEQWQYRWIARPVSSFLPIYDPEEEAIPREAALYDLEVTITHPQHRELNLTLKRLGWRQRS